jgi:ABC-type lipoprotein release transport system permease subunit
MNPLDFILAAVVGVGSCVLATILPAVSAAQLRPADGLRAE